MTSQTITPRSRYQPRVVSKFQKVHPIGSGQGSVFGSEIDFATREQSRREKLIIVRPAEIGKSGRGRVCTGKPQHATYRFFSIWVRSVAKSGNSVLESDTRLRYIYM